MAAILIGTLDTKGDEVAFVRDLLHNAGLATLVIDVGPLGPPSFEPDISREAVLRAGGTSGAEVARNQDRGEAVAAAARGAAEILLGLYETGRVDGVLALGGSAGTSIGSTAMHVLPVGVPKVLVSTLASGQTRPYVGGSDLALFPSVCDLAGLNRITRSVLANAAHALAGMIAGRRASDSLFEPPHQPIVTATMFGVTTPCVTRARRRLEEAGLEVVVFHATGVGGQAMEALIRERRVAAVLDLTTTELADEIAGGVMSAGPTRLHAAVASSLPQVLSVGAVDMVNFGPPDTVPAAYQDRLLHRHNPQVTLMRTTPDENARIALRIVESLAPARAPTILLLPRLGVSALDGPGRPFHDPDADEALFSTLRDGLANHEHVRVVDRQEHINDSSFADFAASTLIELLAAAGSTHDERAPT